MVIRRSSRPARLGARPGAIRAHREHRVFSDHRRQREAAKTAYTELKSRIVKTAGRRTTCAYCRAHADRRDDRAEAKAQLDMLQGWLSEFNAFALVSNRIGMTSRSIRSMGRSRSAVTTVRSVTFSRTLLTRAPAARGCPARLYNVTAAARGHWVMLRTPQRIADIFEDWFRAGYADGFVIMPRTFPARSTILSISWCRIAAPRHFPKDYAGATLQDHLTE